jgi:3-oxoacyl-[acyl-carrier-protein] synthase II
MTGRRRVAVTGVGLRTPAGCDPADLIRALDGGRTLAEPVPELVSGNGRVTIGGRIPEFDLAEYVPDRELRQMERPTVLALVTATDALRDAGFSAEAGYPGPDTFGVAVGTGLGNQVAMERINADDSVQLSRVHPSTVMKVMNNSAVARISVRFGAAGFSATYFAACASGGLAIGESMRRIQSGELLAALAGGVDTPVTPFTVSAFSRMRVLSTRNEDPASASRPFDSGRDGFVLADGASFLLLEEREHARARGARIYGELVGYFSNSDAYHAVEPRPDGAAAAACMRRAIAEAGIKPGDLGHVNANATSTWYGDEAESRAIAQVFGDECPPVTAPKGVLGHAIGAAAAVEAFASLRFSARGEVPPIANLRDVPAAVSIDVIAGKPRFTESPYALSNSFGFGGHNACLVLIPPGD